MGAAQQLKKPGTTVRPFCRFSGNPSVSGSDRLPRCSGARGSAANAPQPNTFHLGSRRLLMTITYKMMFVVAPPRGGNLSHLEYIQQYAWGHFGNVVLAGVVGHRYTT